MSRDAEMPSGYARIEYSDGRVDYCFIDGGIEGNLRDISRLVKQVQDLLPWALIGADWTIKHPTEPTGYITTGGKALRLSYSEAFDIKSRILDREFGEV